MSRGGAVHRKRPAASAAVASVTCPVLLPVGAVGRLSVPGLRSERGRKVSEVIPGEGVVNNSGLH